MLQGYLSENRNVVLKLRSMNFVFATDSFLKVDCATRGRVLIRLIPAGKLNAERFILEHATMRPVSPELYPDED